MRKACQVKNQLESEAEVQHRLDDEWNIYDEENGKVLWNPIVKIRQYRNYDPLCNVNFPILFYSKVLDKHQRIFYELYTQEERTLMIKAFQLVLKYQEILISKRWPYSLYEWFVIIEYYQACGSAIKTSRMLEALDGKYGGIIPRYIKSRERTIVEYHQKFKQMIPHYGRFMSFIHTMIENDPQLNNEHNIILQNRDQGQMDYEKRILERMPLKDMSLSELCYSLVGKNLNNNNAIAAQLPISDDNNSKTGITKLLDNGTILYETEKISIYHSNPNYKNEVREFTSTLAILKDRLRHPLLIPQEREKLLTEIKEFKASKPKRKIHCGPFHPSKLPIEVIERLRKEGKLRLIDFF
jgi:hypothetical protein